MAVENIQRQNTKDTKKVLVFSDKMTWSKDIDSNSPIPMDPILSPRSTDVITIPAKTPHWFKEIPTQTIAYYAVSIEN